MAKTENALTGYEKIKPASAQSFDEIFRRSLPRKLPVIQLKDDQMGPANPVNIACEEISLPALYIELDNEQLAVRDELGEFQ